MKTIKFALAAALLGAAATCGAQVPVIRLLPLAPLVGQGAVGPGQGRLSAGSFATEAAALMPLVLHSRYGVLVAARPLPASGPVLVLLLGCLVYLGRGRRRGFSLRPAHGLLERSADAPARV
jgi:hypothetical protein